MSALAIIESRALLPRVSAASALGREDDDASPSWALATTVLLSPVMTAGTAARSVLAMLRHYAGAAWNRYRKLHIAGKVRSSLSCCSAKAVYLTGNCSSSSGSYSCSTSPLVGHKAYSAHHIHV